MANPNDIFADAKLRQQQLQEQLAAAPSVELLGVVSPTGVTGGKSRGEELWTLKVVLEAWRITGGELQPRPLRIQRKLADQELVRLQKLIAAYAVIKIRARVVSESPFGGPEGLLESFLGAHDSDRELNDQAVRLQKPVSYADPVFGTFTLDRRIGWFTGGAVWKGHTIALHLSAKEPAGVQAALKTAQALWQAQDGWDQRIRDYAVQKLLPLKNKNWLGEEEAEVTADQFKQRMKLEAVTVRPDGAFDFWHQDGDLFWGHAIEITGNLIQGPTHADIPG